jgi:hypothetical protein
MISFAPRFTSLRRTASRTMARKAPVYGSDFACSVRSIDLPVRSRPSLREPSHSPAASTALSQLMGYGTATSSRKAGASLCGGVQPRAICGGAWRLHRACGDPAGAAGFFPTPLRTWLFWLLTFSCLLLGSGSAPLPRYFRLLPGISAFPISSATALFAR